MAALDSSIVNISLPVLKHAFGTRMSTIEWVSLTYLLTLAATIVPFSRLADMYGRRWMYTIGFFVFIVGSLSCGLAASLPVLFGSRIVQALGAAMLQSNSVSIITAATPAKDRGKAIGIQAMAQGVGLSLGPVIGGTFLTFLGWRWIFYVNVPVGIMGTLLGIMLLPADERHPRSGKFDVWGTMVLAPTLVAIVYVLNSGSQADWGSLVMLVCYGVIAAGLTGFWWIERRVPTPIVDLSLFRNRTFVVGNASVALSFAVMYAVMFLAPFYMDDVHHLNALTSGIVLMVIPVGMAIFTPLSGFLADRVGPRLPSVLGMSVVCVGALAISVFTVWYAGVLFAAGFFVIGCGMGVFTPANNSQVMGTLPSSRLGVGGGILNLARTLGMGFGVAMGGLSYQAFLRMYGAIDENRPRMDQMIPAFRDSFLLVGVLALVVVLLLVLGARRSRS